MWTPAPPSQGGYIQGKLWISPQRKQWQVFVQQPAGHHLPIGPHHASLEAAKRYAALIPNPAGTPMKRASKLNPKAAFHVYHPDYSGYGIEYKRKLRHPGYGDTAGMPTGEPYDVKVGSRAFPSIAAAKAWIDTQDHAQRVKEHETRSRRKNPDAPARSWTPTPKKGLQFKFGSVPAIVTGVGPQRVLYKYTMGPYVGTQFQERHQKVWENSASLYEPWGKKNPGKAKRNPIYKHRVTGKVDREYIDLPDIPDYVSEARRAEMMAPYVKARKEMDARWAADGYYPLRKSNPTYKHPVTGKLKHVTTFAPRIPAYMEGDEWEPVRMRIQAEHAANRREEDQQWAAAGYRPIDAHGRWQRRQIAGPAHPLPNPKARYVVKALPKRAAWRDYAVWDRTEREWADETPRSLESAEGVARMLNRAPGTKRANPGRLDVEFYRRLPALVIVGTTSARARTLADEVRSLMALPRLRVVVSGAAGHSAAEIAAAIQAKLNRS